MAPEDRTALLLLGFESPTSISLNTLRFTRKDLTLLYYVSRQVDTWALFIDRRWIHADHLSNLMYIL